MAKYFILGETGKSELWIVDLDAKKVEQVTDAALAATNDKELIHVVENARKHGIRTIKGLSVAVATSTRSAPGTRSSITDPTDD